MRKGIEGGEPIHGSQLGAPHHARHRSVVLEESSTPLFPVLLRCKYEKPFGDSDIIHRDSCSTAQSRDHAAGPVVLRGVAHWLCHEWQSGHYQVLAILLGDGQAAAIEEVPELCLQRRCTGPRLPVMLKDLLMVSTDGWQLGLLVAEVLVISLWTLSEDSESWGARRVLVNRISMLQSVELHFDLMACRVFNSISCDHESS